MGVRSALTMYTATALLLIGAMSSSTAPASDVAPRSDVAVARISDVIGRDQQAFHAITRATGFDVQNARQGIRASFTDAGADIRVGTAGWRVALMGYGYGSKLQKVATTRPSATANRVEYRRGAITEWYVNGPGGLEQGFTLARAPDERNGQPLTLALALPPELAATVEATGRGLTLWQGDAAVLRYRGLTANDADGRELSAWLEIVGKRLLIRVDDLAARYPVVVDPVMQEAVLKASDGDLSFGDSIASSGDTIVVGSTGANSNQGVAYVFVKPAAGWGGTLSENAKLSASDGAPNDRFGSVAISGDTIVVGASNASVGANENQGAAYVFVKPAGGWSGMLQENAKLTARSTTGRSGDHFGGTVAVAGDAIAVGEDQAYCCNSALARAYVFVQPAGGWSGALHESATLANAQELDDYVDVFVAMSGDASSIVASFHGITQAGDGAHYLNVFAEPDAGWSGALQPSATLAHSDGVISGTFAVNQDGTAVVVGTPYDESSADAAAAYLFLKPAGGWSGAVNESARLTASSEDAHHQYADAVAIGGDTIVLGEAPPNECGVQGVCGLQRHAYVYVKPSTGWSGSIAENQQLDGPPSDYYFGWTMAIDGDTIIIGDLDGGFGGPAEVYLFAKVKGDFSLGTIAPMTISPAGSGSASALVKSITDYLGDFSNSVALSITGQPAGITTSLNPASVMPPVGGSASAAIGVQVAPFITPEQFSLTLTGTSGVLVHSRIVSVTVAATTGGVTQVVGAELAAGCIDNSGIANAVTSKLAAAQADIDAGDIQGAKSILLGLLALLQAQSGKHIGTTCTINGMSFDPDAVLMADVQALLTSL